MREKDYGKYKDFYENYEILRLYRPDYVRETFKKIRNEKLRELKKEKRKLIFKKGLVYTLEVGATIGILLTLPAIGAGVATAIGHSPFKREDVVREMHIKTEFNTEEGKNVSKQCAPYEKEKSVVHYHTGWVEDNNQYVSEVSTYDATGITYDQIDECLRENKNISEVLGDPVFSEEITKSSITEEESKEKSHYEGVIYSVDYTNANVTPQTYEENAKDIGYSLIIPGLLGFIPTVFIARSLDNNCFYDMRLPLDTDIDHVKDDIYIQEENKKSLKLKKNSD